ncbi:estradiol 17-beta-dehydrogenase 11-like [Bombus pyrosoma]|uniref:estradiol 17-beta-dehydrogenase 11-like n=1 Tax=Bombus pyrosoma TaxID=396416 RepID=UPI001CB95C41|nr:estradiol 17-beta-dehydrogenase 11-like [Bombus pyrosoma]XP_043593346.1 estradiol 17-beta-dehydrogenase 11-like [Bombus pyrosoma]
MSFLVDVANVIGFLILTVGFIIKNTIRLFIPEKYKMKSIAGEIALVTGGGGVLGRLVTLRLANLGAIVVIWDVNKAGIEETVKLVKSAGGICYGYVCDLCDREDIYKKAEQVRKEVGKVTILINNAGIGNGYRLLDTPDNLIIRTMEVNVMSHFWTTKAFLPSMIEDNKGHIVSIASMAGHIGVSHLVSYCTSKFAAIGFDEALHMELVAEGYKINSTVVCPFFIRSTGMFDNVSTRYLPRLTPNDVADRIISAIRCNEKVAIVPGYLCIFLVLKWAFPWECADMLVRGLLLNKIHSSDSPSPPAKKEEEIIPTMLPKDPDTTVIHQQLTRRISSSERKP